MYLLSQKKSALNFHPLPPHPPPLSSINSQKSNFYFLCRLGRPKTTSPPHGEIIPAKSLKNSTTVSSNNMGKKSQPVISKCKETENWTKVSFKPDLAKFNMTHLEDDVVALMKKRVVDLAGCLGKTVKVELNGQKVPVKSFAD